jgi:hypothetical protein
MPVTSVALWLATLLQRRLHDAGGTR